MRRIVVALIVLLSLSGVVLVVAVALGLPERRVNLVSLAHIWLGLFFCVLFPLYGWDHVMSNRRWLRKAALVTLSGVTQAAAGTVLLLSGVLLLLYDVEVWPRVRLVHQVLTYVLGAALALHYLSPKAGSDQPGPDQRAGAARGAADVVEGGAEGETQDQPASGG